MAVTIPRSPIPDGPPDPDVPTNPRGEAMVAELRWVHDMIRRDLRTVRQLADGVAAGLPAGQARDGIRSLAASGPLWQLRINCLQYCRFVHSHHHAESILLFPALREANPTLNDVVDKLESDHLSVSHLLDEVESAAQALADQDEPALRGRLTRALHRLSVELLAHLDYEEEHISGTLATWSRWPVW
jgi:hemerythrin HHE cation binding domain-containing protein